MNILRRLLMVLAALVLLGAVCAAGALLGYLIYYAAVGRRRSRFPEKMPWAR